MLLITLENQRKRIIITRGNISFMCIIDILMFTSWNQVSLMHGLRYNLVDVDWIQVAAIYFLTSLGIAIKVKGIDEIMLRPINGVIPCNFYSTNKFLAKLKNLVFLYLNNLKYSESPCHIFILILNLKLHSFYTSLCNFCEYRHYWNVICRWQGTMFCDLPKGFRQAFIRI